MKDIIVEDLLQTAGLKKTKRRIALLSYFLNAKNAKSYFDIKEVLSEEFDKSTLYRNLTTFEEAGIIHRINGQTGVAKYAIGKIKDKKDNHAHFICEKCDTIYCMKNVSIDNISVPAGFKTTTIQTIVKGICSDC